MKNVFIRKYATLVMLSLTMLMLLSIIGCIEQPYSDFYSLQEPLVNKIGYGIVKEYDKEYYVPSIVVEDLEGDGKKEIVYKTSGGEYLGHLYILENNWTIRAKCIAGVPDMDRLLAKDLDDDDKKEIINTGRLWDTKRDLSEDELHLRIFDLNCNKLNEYPLEGVGMGIDFIEDVDGDGKEEIIIATMVRAIDVAVYVLDEGKVQRSGDENLVNKVKALIEEESFPEFRKGWSKLRIGSKTYRMPATEQDSKILVDDLNSDDKEEIIVLAKYPANAVSYTMIFVFDSDGNLLWNYKYPTWIDSATIADLDNDGNKEIFVAGHHNNPITVFGKK